MIDDLEELLKSVVADVTGTMLRLSVRAMPMKSGPMDGEAHIAGSIGSIGKFVEILIKPSETSA